MKKLLLVPALYITVGCQQLAKIVAGFDNPKLENIQSVQSYARQHHLDAATNVIAKDKESMKQLLWVFNKKLPDAVLFDTAGKELIYRSPSETCTAGLFKIIPNLDKTTSLKKGTQDLENIIIRYTKPLFGSSDTVIDGSDYYLMINWAKYAGKKNKENVLEWENLAKSNKKVRIKVIKVNMDFQDSWGLTEKEIQFH